MKDDSFGWSRPFCSSDLFHLMFENFVCPGPVEEVAKSRILGSKGETIYAESMRRVITRVHIFAVGLLHRG
jgi:hypothetical protein